MSVTLRNREGRKSRVVYVFLKGKTHTGSASGFFVYISSGICMFVYLDFGYTIYQACISNVHVTDINLFYFGTIHRTICIMKIMGDIVVCI